MGAIPARPGRDMIDDLTRRVIALEKAERARMTRNPHMPLIDMSAQGEPWPQEGAMMLDYTGLPNTLSTATYKPVYGFGGEWHPFQPGEFEIKLVSDLLPVVTTTTVTSFVFAIPRMMNNWTLTEAHAYVTTVSAASLVTVQLYNVTRAWNMLSTPITIDVGEFDSYTAATAPVINAANDTVLKSDQIACVVTYAGSTAKGLGVWVTFE